VILGSHDEHLCLLSAMEERQLLTSGEYFVVGVNLDAYNQEDPTQYMKCLLREEVDPYIMDAFTGYLGVVPSSSDSFNDFSMKVKEYLSKPPFDSPMWAEILRLLNPKVSTR